AHPLLGRAPIAKAAVAGLRGDETGARALIDEVERSGHRDGARALPGRLEPPAPRTPPPGVPVGLRHPRRPAADDAEAETRFQDALRPELARWLFAQARPQLAYGTWLRRHRRVAESRAMLRAAREAFDALGAALWSEQARQELRAAGETSHRPTQN